jgi:hypothetical protein
MMPSIPLYYRPANLNIPIITHTLPLVKPQVPFVQDDIIEFLPPLYLYVSKSKRSIPPPDMSKKFLEETFTLVRQRENPPEISSL